MSLKASASAKTSAAASGAVYAQMIGGATQAISVREIVATARTAIPTSLGLARSFSVGTATAAGVATGLAHRVSKQGEVSGRLETEWSASPTGPTGAHHFLRRATFGGATGSRVTILDPHLDAPIVVEPTGMTGMGLLLLNVGSGAGSDLDIHVTWEFGHASDS